MPRFYFGLSWKSSLFNAEKLYIPAPVFKSGPAQNHLFFLAIGPTGHTKSVPQGLAKQKKKCQLTSAMQRSEYSTVKERYVYCTSYCKCNTYLQQPVSNEIHLSTTTYEQILAPGKYDQSILKGSEAPWYTKLQRIALTIQIRAASCSPSVPLALALRMRVSYKSNMRMNACSMHACSARASNQSAWT